MKRRIWVLIAVLVMAVFVAVCFVGCTQIELEPPFVSGDNGDNVDNIDNDDDNDNDNDDDNDDDDDDNNNNNNDDDNGNNDNGNDDDNNNDDDDDDDDDDDNNNDTPMSTKTTVYYTNSGRWTNVYAYCWNYASPQSPKKAWPGEKLQEFGTSGFDEKQYKIEVDYSVYNRIIFNNGAGTQTKDLVVSSATSGYYGEDGVFTMGTENYGRVTEKTFTDSKNLNYITGSQKKVWVYTPPGYSTAKKYGVLYMFDGQNAFGAASGVNENSNSWLVDVAVTSLVKNGGDGVIVVGIDNGSGGSNQRDQELTMSRSFGTLTSLGSAQYGYFTNGKLDELGNFIKETVMPWVKDNYSVYTSREKTGIVGSSSGGIAAYYLGLRDNDLYGYIGAFSPANGLFQSSDWTRFYNGKNGFAAGKPKVYVYCGQNDHDLEDMLLPETKKIKSGLIACGFSASDITENYVDGGTHNEAYWRIAFPEFLGKMVG
ncbi:MAG: starch-binding protein [Clostridiales bacterium]|nr:starch-binding protein [Clostridiales bacterium]